MEVIGLVLFTTPKEVFFTICNETIEKKHRLSPGPICSERYDGIYRMIAFKDLSHGWLYAASPRLSPIQWLVCKLFYLTRGAG